MKQWLFLVLLVSFTISAMGWVLFRFFVHYNHSVCNFGYEGSMLVGQVWSGFLFFTDILVEKSKMPRFCLMMLKGRKVFGEHIGVKTVCEIDEEKIKHGVKGCSDYVALFRPVALVFVYSDLRRHYIMSKTFGT